MDRTFKYFIALLLLLSAPKALYPCDEPHFYRAAYFFGEPRLGEKGMSTLEVTFAGGTTWNGRNGCGTKVSTLDIYGLHNMLALGRGIPLDSTNPIDQAISALLDINATPACSCLGQLSLRGKFKTGELTFLATQNIAQGFFIQVHLPIRKPAMEGIIRNDTTPETCQNAAWQNFLALFNQVLDRYHLCLGSIRRIGVGDLSCLFGWACNYQDTQVLDFIDFTAKAGILFPTGQIKSENSIGDLSLGYNGHMGFLLSMEGSLGIYDWLTIGAHAGGRLFLADTDGKGRCYRMKTSCCQSGLIKLAHGKASLKPGSIADIGLFLKADHVVRGLSLLAGYSYDTKGCDMLTPCNTTIFNAAIVNSDAQLHAWKMHTMHLIIDYDFTKEDMCVGPRLALIYNIVLAGKHIFTTPMFGGSLGLDISWNF